MQVSPKRNLGYGWEHETNTLYAWSRTCRYCIGTEVVVKRQNDNMQGNPRRSQVIVQSMAHSPTSGKLVHEKKGALDHSFGK